MASHPEFDWILQALNGDESATINKSTCQLPLLEQMAPDDGELYHAHWPQGKHACNQICMQGVVPKPEREQVMALHHDTPVAGHLIEIKFMGSLCSPFGGLVCGMILTNGSRSAQPAKLILTHMDLIQQSKNPLLLPMPLRRWSWAYT